MIYLLQFEGYIKLGWTKEWEHRAARGFWHLRHPPQLCGKLDDYEIIHIFAGGSEDLEKTLHRELQGIGEFYPENDLEKILTLLRTQPELEEKPIPTEKQNCTKIVKQACCGGKTHRCFNCDKSFSRFEHLSRHFKKVHLKR